MGARSGLDGGSLFPHSEQDYLFGRELMTAMVESSQRPEGGNRDFVATIGTFLDHHGVEVREVPDPEYSDRALLIADFGDTTGQQSLAAVSHSDVVGVDGQSWQTDPWKLTEIGDTWYGRGVCDTHGSGVAMTIAGMKPEVQRALHESGTYVSVIFTADEEAPTAEWSYRGAKLAAGQLGVPGVMESKYFIAGEPTERDGVIRAMRAHKGRQLLKLTWETPHAGHTAEEVENAFNSAVQLGAKAIELGESRLRAAAQGDDIAKIFTPDRSTVQLSAAEVKSGTYSITPNRASIAIDLRTLPGYHDEHRAVLQELIASEAADTHMAFDVEVIDDFAGTQTDPKSPVVVAAEAATSMQALGFNGGDEGEIFRRAGKEGVTIGPGSLGFAHAPNEELPVSSLFSAISIYSKLFYRSPGFDTGVE